MEGFRFIIWEADDSVCEASVAYCDYLVHARFNVKIRPTTTSTEACQWLLMYACINVPWL